MNSTDKIINTNQQLQQQQQNPNLQTADGKTLPIPKDSSQVVDVADTSTSLTFQSGNLNQVMTMPSTLSQKLTILTKTFLPLMEKAMIDLLGQSDYYQREECTAQVNMQDNGFLVTGKVVYGVQMFIGVDVEEQAIRKDSVFIYNTISVIPNFNITHCVVDVGEGKVTVEFYY
jgi:hypothetical protein